MNTPVTTPRPVRSCGLLLHVTSLPGAFGIGDLGPAAYRWVDALADAGQTWWQVLPLGPTGYGDSPYQCFSALAGNPALVSLELLLHDGLLKPDDVPSTDFAENTVDYGAVLPFKAKLTDQAWKRFQADAAPVFKAEFAAFRQSQSDWLDDFALFMALKDHQDGVSWQEWPTPLRHRDSAALQSARGLLSDAIGLHQFRQFLFARQWAALRDQARRRGVRLIGDMPIFVALDSADVWANPELFLLDAQRRPTVVAGVPPDYFAATGQLWGNPLYDWSAHRSSGYAWWAKRMQAALAQVDLIRLDHFRGFEAAWHVPAGSPTAEGGEWVPGPGADLFDALGPMPLIAEDLGVITPPVDALRLRLGWPGMRIMQFAFGGAREERFLPHHYERHTVVYTGTHDNDTTQGWYEKLTPAERRFFREYAPDTGEGAAWQLIRLAWASVADWALAPFQDVLGIGNDGRMNSPGQPAGNWRWRATESQMAQADWDRLAKLTKTYQR